MVPLFSRLRRSLQFYHPTVVFADLELDLDLDLTKRLPGSSWVHMSSFLWIGPAVWPTIKNVHTRITPNIRSLLSIGITLLHTDMNHRSRHVCTILAKFEGGFQSRLNDDRRPTFLQWTDISLRLWFLIGFFELLL